MGLPIARLAWVVFKTQVDFQADIRSPEYTLIRSDHQSLQPKVWNHSNSSLIWVSWHLDHVSSHLPHQVLIFSTGQLLAATSSLSRGYFLIHLGIKHCHKLETINTGMLAVALNISLPEARSFTYTTLGPWEPSFMLIRASPLQKTLAVQHYPVNMRGDIVFGSLTDLSECIYTELVLQLSQRWHGCMRLIVQAHSLF